MFDKQWDPNENIIKIRTGKSKTEYYYDLIKFIENEVDNKYIFDGLGELIDENQKKWGKDHLVEELLFQLKIRVKR